ncbi:DJ-1/PfpI family protein [Streptomyces mirabilis]
MIVHGPNLSNHSRPQQWPAGLLPPVATYEQVVPVARSGFSVTGAAGLDALEKADTVIVPGYDDVDADVPSAVLAALRAAHGRGARIVSICSGAFALAATGLLDGRPATTHWQVSDQLQRRYPSIEVQPNRMFVDDGDILTSAGVTAGIDLCLHLIRIDHGAAASNARARSLVAPPQRPGGQAQYIDRLRSQPSSQELATVRDWMLDTWQRRLPSTISPHASTWLGAPSSAAFATRPGPHPWHG